MRILGRKILAAFKNKHADACPQANCWEAEATEADWCKPSDIKQRYATASILPGNHVIFNLKGNKYRLKVKINYEQRLVLITNAGTHNEYMKW